MSKPKVGWWASFCCEEDLHQIKDEADLAEHLEEDSDDKEDGIHGYDYWHTKEEALSEILAREEQP